MSYSKPRITLGMSVGDIVYAITEGNPGAIRVVMELIEKGPKIDPDNALGPIGPLLNLDTLDCYGSRIWMLYKDVCGQDLVKVEGVLRAIGFGYTSDAAVNAAIDGTGKIDVDALLTQVRERLPRFAAAA